jgi:hypothetical protein
MTFFDDMTRALSEYPLTDVDIEIVEVALIGSALNVGEFGQFRVKVTNRGPLNLTGVTLHVYGLNGATVANNGVIAPFVSDFVTQELPTIAAHGGTQVSVGSPLKFRAPSAPQPARTLVRATLETWDANLDHILVGHSDPMPAGPRGSYAAEVRRGRT